MKEHTLSKLAMTILLWSGAASSPQAASPQEKSPKTRLLSGIVWTLEGSPVADVEIFVRPRGFRSGPRGFGRCSARTDAAGRFLQVSVPIGRAIEIHAVRDGWAPGYSLVEAGPADVAVEIVLRAGTTVTGRLVDEVGDPIEGAIVGLIESAMNSDNLGFRLSESEAAHQVVSGKDGGFAIPAVAPGNYAATSFAQDFSPEFNPFLAVEEGQPLNLGTRTLDKGRGSRRRSGRSADRLSGSVCDGTRPDSGARTSRSGLQAQSE